MNTRYDLRGIKDYIGLVAAVLIIVALIMTLAVPIGKVKKQTNTIYTYFHQAQQAATPEQFATALRKLDEALNNAGMVHGNTVPLIAASGPHMDMAYQRERYLSLASRADALASMELSSTEVSTGLADLRVALYEVRISPYGFWFSQQGGALYAALLPFILFILGVMAIIIAGSLPEYYYRRVKTGLMPT